VSRASLDYEPRRSETCALYRGVAIVQRFGGALNRNIHVRALLLDGVFAPERDGSLFFQRVRLADLDVAEVLAAVEARVLRLVALIDQEAVIARILAHLGLPTAVPATRGARSPPAPHAPDRRLAYRDTDFDFD
jgi:hypothetical protein